jgi:hypothetical protein
MKAVTVTEYNGTPRVYRSASGNLTFTVRLNGALVIKRFEDTVAAYGDGQWLTAIEGDTDATETD